MGQPLIWCWRHSCGKPDTKSTKEILWCTNIMEGPTFQQSPVQVREESYRCPRKRKMFQAEDIAHAKALQLAHACLRTSEEASVTGGE